MVALILALKRTEKELSVEQPIHSPAFDCDIHDSDVSHIVTAASPVHMVHVPKMCANINCSKSAYLRCRGGCSITMYCSLECQKYDWVVHKADCGMKAVPVIQKTTDIVLAFDNMQDAHLHHQDPSLTCKLIDLDMESKIPCVLCSQEYPTTSFLSPCCIACIERYNLKWANANERNKYRNGGAAGWYFVHFDARKPVIVRRHVFIYPVVGSCSTGMYVFPGICQATESGPLSPCCTECYIMALRTATRTRVVERPAGIHPCQFVPKYEDIQDSDSEDDAGEEVQRAVWQSVLQTELHPLPVPQVSKIVIELEDDAVEDVTLVNEGSGTYNNSGPIGQIFTSIADKATYQTEDGAIQQVQVSTSCDVLTSEHTNCHQTHANDNEKRDVLTDSAYQLCNVFRSRTTASAENRDSREVSERHGNTDINRASTTAALYMDSVVDRGLCVSLRDMFTFMYRIINLVRLRRCCRSKVKSA
jgi:hypothetical protein